MSEEYELSEFQKELEKAEHLFSMYWTRKELKNRLDKIEQKDKYINSLLQYTNDLETRLQQKENIIKEARETLNNKRTIMTTKLLNGEHCDYEELLYQVDEEIRKILDKVEGETR